MHADCLKALSSAHYPGPEEDPTHFSSVYRTSDLWNLDPAHVPGTRQNPAHAMRMALGMAIRFER